jgi:hypothetical protein
LLILSRAPDARIDWSEVEATVEGERGVSAELLSLLRVVAEVPRASTEVIEMMVRSNSLTSASEVTRKSVLICPPGTVSSTKTSNEGHDGRWRG